MTFKNLLFVLHLVILGVFIGRIDLNLAHHFGKPELTLLFIYLSVSNIDHDLN